MGNDTEKPKSKRFIFSFKNILLGISLLLVIYLLLSGWQISKVNIGFFELESPKTVTDNITSISITQATASLRPLEPLETAQNMAFLPDNIYGYAYAFEIADYQNSIELSNVCDGYRFELQKSSGNVYLIGYITETDLNSITADKAEKKVTLYPYNVQKDKKNIALNLKDILEISDKDIDIDGSTTISILELTASANRIPSEVTEHRAQSCL